MKLIIRYIARAIATAGKESPNKTEAWWSRFETNYPWTWIESVRQARAALRTIRKLDKAS